MIIETIEDLLSIVRELSETHEKRIFFRGQPDSTKNLIPSIQRPEYKFYESEVHMTNNFYVKVKPVLKDSPRKKNYAAWLSLMQHYGLPTRLLDWSISPLIALYFAVEQYENVKYMKSDACVWALFPKTLNDREIPRNSKYKGIVYPSDDRIVNNMAVRAFKEDEPIDKRCEDKIIACYSIENNLRMYKQQSAFTIHNSKRIMNRLYTDDVLIQMIIPSNKRKYLLDSLELLGITRSFVYPDIENIAAEVKEYYQRKYDVNLQRE